MNFLLRLLHRLPPETSHHLIVFLLKLRTRLFFNGKKFLEHREAGTIVVPAYPALRFRNRLGLAAGFDKNAELCQPMEGFGFGFLEVGTVTPQPQPGNPRPRIFRVPTEGLVNRMGFPNVGLPEFRKNLLRARPYVHCPLLANIGKGKNTPAETAHEDYEACISSLKDCVDGFVINVSSPNTPGLTGLQNETFLEKIAKIFPRDLPVFIKLSSDLNPAELENLCRWSLSQPSVSGLVLANTSRTIAQKVSAEDGGYSGPQLLPIACDFMGRAREIVKEKKVLIGVGGVQGVEDYRRLRNAGADLVEVYTGLIYYGPKWVQMVAGTASLV